MTNTDNHDSGLPSNQNSSSEEIAPTFVTANFLGQVIDLRSPHLANRNSPYPHARIQQVPAPAPASVLPALPKHHSNNLELTLTAQALPKIPGLAKTRDIPRLNEESPALAYPTTARQHLGLLSSLTDAQVIRFHDMSEPRVLVHGQPAMSEHSPLAGVFYIDNGEIELCRREGDGDRIFFRLGTGDAFGMIETFIGMERSLFTARARGFVHLRFMKGDPVRAFEWENDNRGALVLLENFLTILSNQLRRRPEATSKNTEQGGDALGLRSLTMFEALQSHHSADVLLNVSLKNCSPTDPCKPANRFWRMTRTRLDSFSFNQVRSRLPERTER